MTADLLVLGLGPAGCLAAIRAVREGKSVTLAGSAPRAGLAGEHLAPEAAALLRSLDLWPVPGTHPCPGVRLAWGGKVSEIDHLYHPLGNGCVVQRPAFEQWLLDRARAQGTRVVENFRLRDLSRTGNHWVARGVRRVLTAREICDATGRAAAAARRLGARRYRCDRLVAVGARLWSPHPAPDRFLTVVSSRDGWWYTLGLPNGSRTVVYLSDSDLLGERLHPRVWWQELERTPVLRDLLAGYQPPDRLEAAPAHGSFLEPCQGPAWSAAGDAAATFDPLSSWGLAHALSARSEISPRLYLQRWWEAYRGEGRWPDRVFWKRRALIGAPI